MNTTSNTDLDSMIWYCARLHFRAVVGEAPGEGDLHEVSFRVLRAHDEDHAAVRAEAIGRAEEHEYANDQGQTVRWRLLRVLDVQSLDETAIFDGIEVYSRLEVGPGGWASD